MIRTDLDLRALCDAFMVNSAAALAAATAAAAGNSLAGQGKFSNGQSRYVDVLPFVVRLPPPQCVLACAFNVHLMFILFTNNFRVYIY